MTASPNRRRRMVVNPAVQSRIIFSISWPSVAALVITAVLLGVFSMRLLDEAMVAKVELPSLIPILLTAIGFLIVSLGYLILNALKFSNRIAGPMYRLEKTLASAKAGDYGARAKLRAQDFLVEVADALNEFLADLELKQARIGIGGVDGDAGAAEADGPQGRGAPADERERADAPRALVRDVPGAADGGDAGAAGPL